MRVSALRRLLFGAVAVVFVGAFAAPAVAAGGPSGAGHQGSGCIAHRPNYIEGRFEPAYRAGCSGHDEPELDPISNHPGSAKNLTWTFVLPTDGADAHARVGGEVTAERQRALPGARPMRP